MPWPQTVELLSQHIKVVASFVWVQDAALATTLDTDDEAMQRQVGTWLFELRQHFSRLPAVAHVLTEVLAFCEVLAKNRRDIRYTYEYLLSPEEHAREQDDRSIRNRMRCEPAP